jgi:DNA-binding NtrC family response regulator
MDGRATFASWQACYCAPGWSPERSSLGAEDFPHIATQSRFSGRATDIVPRISKQSSGAEVNGVGAITVFDDEGHIRTLDEIEADLIRLAIGHYRGRMTEVAKRLGIGRSTLYRKLANRHHRGLNYRPAPPDFRLCSDSTSMRPNA